MANPTPSSKAKEQQVDPSETKTQFLGNDTLPDHGEAAKTKLVGELRGKNVNETTFSLNMQGDTNYGAGKVVALDGTFGVFKGNYLLDKCVHRIVRQGYITEIEGHKVLKGHDTGTAPKAPAAKAYTPGASVTKSALESGSPTPLNAQLGASKTFTNPATGNIEPVT